MNFNEILPLDIISMDKTKKRLDNLLKPENALGILEDICIRLAGIYGKSEFVDLKKAIIAFGSDNGVFNQGVSRDRQELTFEHFPNFVKSYSAIGSICSYTNTHMVAIDLGVKSWSKMEGIVDEKISLGTRDFTLEPAMTKEDAEKSMQIGSKYITNFVNDGYNIFALGEMGVSNTTPAASVISVLSENTPDQVTGRGAGACDEIFNNKVNAIKKGIEINNPDKNNPLDVLSKVGSYEIGAMAGAILKAAQLRVPVVLDGIITMAGAMIAQRINPLSKEYLFASHKVRENASLYALKSLGLTAPMELNLCLGEGYGAVLFFDIIEAALYSYKNMKTFDEIKMNRGH